MHRLPSLLVCALLAVGLTACGSTGASPTGGTTSSTGSGTGSGGTGGDAAAPHTMPDAQFLPKATGPCPDLSASGTLTFTPDGNARKVEIWISDAAKTHDGPLVFYWHGIGGSPDEAPSVLGPGFDAILAMGGIVAGMYPAADAGQLPWALCLGGTDETDLRVADEVLACAVQQVGVDLRHVHSVGFSAGAMNNTQFAALRSGYLASIVDYSGARIGNPDEEDPANLYPAMLFYGGPNDQVIVDFATATQTYHDELVAEGHFVIVCDHDMGHTVPANGVASGWQFLLDHPFGVMPEPYANGLPKSFPSYCTL